MNKLEDFKIVRPYTLTADDVNAIHLASPGVNDKDDWAKPELDGMKERLREYLREQQNGRCAYCRLKLHENVATSEIEHIVPKSKKPQWMYEPFNLCLSCKLCNSIKGYRKKILENRADSASTLPRSSSDYKWIHPYLDIYSEHIELVDGVLYRGKTKKGKYTIWLCGLDRYQVAAERADVLISRNVNNYVRIMLLISNPDNAQYVKNIDVLKERIERMIEEYMEEMA